MQRLKKKLVDFLEISFLLFLGIILSEFKTNIHPQLTKIID